MRGIFLVALFMSMLFFVSAETFKINEELDYKIVCFANGFCSGAGVCNITVLYPNNSIVVDNVQMDNQNSYHNYTLSENTLNVVGEYAVTGFCSDAGNAQEIDSVFYITTSGESFTTAQAISIVPLIIIILLFFSMGYNFTNGKWKLKSFFFAMALLVSLILTNAVNTLFGTSNTLSGMGQVSLVVGIAMLSFYVMFILLYYTLDVFRQLRDSKEKRRAEKSDPY